MCFSRGGGQSAAATPAPAPPAPEPVAEQQDTGSARKAQDQSLYGTDTPNLRVDRSTTSGGVKAGGTGLRM